MADSKTAAHNTLMFEDSTLKGKVNVDEGGRTRFGIAEKFHAKELPADFYTTMPAAEALEIATRIFIRQYWPSLLDQCISQRVANKIADANFNNGHGVKFVQQALQQMDIDVVVDGKLGPATLDAINKEDELELLHLIRVIWRQHVLDVDGDRPNELKGLLRRAAA